MGKEDSIQEWLELTGKVVPTPKKVTPKKVTTKTPKKAPVKRKNIVEKVVEKVTNKGHVSAANTKRVRNRNAKGHFVKDDPNTPENEAWKDIPIEPKLTPKTKRKRRKK